MVSDFLSKLESTQMIEEKPIEKPKPKPKEKKEPEIKIEELSEGIKATEFYRTMYLMLTGKTIRGTKAKAIRAVIEVLKEHLRKIEKG